jgi:endoglucanase
MTFLAVAIMAAWPAAAAAVQGQPAAQQAPADLDAWTAANAMGIGVNIGNTLENTTAWETGWGNPPITQEYVQSLALHGFRVVRVPVAWDTYANNGRIDRDKLKHVGEVVDWITSAGMFAVVNIHWDGGWIDSGDQKKFPKTYHTFSAEAERKFQSYWNQIATYLADRDQRVIFEALNEESNFENAGSEKQAYATLGRVNQLFIDTVRATGGNNARRLLIIGGYGTDIDKTTSGKFILPKDTIPHKLLLSVHYYTPWPFAGMTRDESWGKMRPTWGTPDDIAELKRQFDKMEAYSEKNDIPIFLGEFAPAYGKDPASRTKWIVGVGAAALGRGMVPVFWEIGQDLSRRPPFALSPELNLALQKLRPLTAE